MDEQHTPQDKRIEAVKERLRDELVDEDGRPADDDTVERAVEEAAAPLADAPVQEFAPLLIEHQVRDELRQHGLRRDVRDEGPDPSNDVVNDGDEDPEPAARDLDSVNLATQQGAARR